jgi:hypothetical protein
MSNGTRIGSIDTARFLASLIVLEVLHGAIGRLWPNNTALVAAIVSFYIIGYIFNREVDVLSADLIIYCLHGFFYHFANPPLAAWMQANLPTSSALWLADKATRHGVEQIGLCILKREPSLSLGELWLLGIKPLFAVVEYVVGDKAHGYQGNMAYDRVTDHQVFANIKSERDTPHKRERVCSEVFPL